MSSVAEVNAANNALIASKAKAAADKAAGNTTTGTAASDSTSAFASVSSIEDFFLKLLTTQLQNQDPSNPTDTTQLTQQISQLTSNEQQVKTNANLEKLIAATNQSQAGTAVSYIGHEVESAGASGQVVGGQGAFTYILPAGVTNASVNADRCQRQRGVPGTRHHQNRQKYSGVGRHQ